MVKVNSKICIHTSLWKNNPSSRQGRNQYCRDQYDTQYLAILSQETSQAKASQPAKVVQSKMSNLPLTYPTVSFLQQPRGGNMMRGLDRGGQRLGCGYCKWTALLRNTMATAHSSRRWYCLYPPSNIKGTYGHDEGAVQPHGFICVCVDGWEQQCPCDWSIQPFPPLSSLQTYWRSGVFLELM